MTPKEYREDLIFALVFGSLIIGVCIWMFSLYSDETWPGVIGRGLALIVIAFTASTIALIARR